MKYLPAPPDPYKLNAYGVDDYFNNIWTINRTNRQTLNRAYRSYVPPYPALKTLVLFAMGQSLWSDILPTLYVPANFDVIDNFNIFDSSLYDCNGPLLGTTYAWDLPPLGPGNVASRVADTLVGSGKFDRVIIVSMALGNTKIFDWGNPSGLYYNRYIVALRRLADRGITPSTPGVTFAGVMGIGEADFAAGTTGAAYTASAQGFISNLYANGFSGRLFWDQESSVGETNNQIRTAQAGLVNNTTVFLGADFDSIPQSSRNPGDVHFNDLGGLQAANLTIAKMAASGSPF